MSSRIKFALKVYGVSLILFGVMIIVFSEPTEIVWRLLGVFAYAILWVGVPAYFIRLLYEFVIALGDKWQERKKNQMDHQDFNFDRACKQAGIRVMNNSRELTIRTVFNPLHQSSVGSLLYLFLGFAFGIITITKSTNLLWGILGSLLGFGIGVIAFLAILSQLTSFFKIHGNVLEFSNRLKLIRHNLTSGHKIKMKTRVEHVKLKSRPGSGSDFRIVELYICDSSNEHLILDFQMNEKDSSVANRLGNEISTMIKDKIKSL